MRGELESVFAAVGVATAVEVVVGDPENGVRVGFSDVWVHDVTVCVCVFAGGVLCVIVGLK